METHLSLKVDSHLLNLNMIGLHSDVVEAVMFRLFYFDSNDESGYFITPISLSIFLSLRDQVSYMLLLSITIY